MPYKDPAKHRECCRKYYYERGGRESHRQYHLALKLETFEAYGGAYCVQCGFDDHRALNLDHINGGGNKERAQRPSNTIYLALKKEGFPSGYQVLCANCNSIKKYTNSEFTRGR